MSKIVETSPAAMVLTGEDGRWIGFNKAAERIFGYNRKEVLGKKTPEQDCTTSETIKSLKKSGNS
jgi:PAS domain S-box-containing protein